MKVKEITYKSVIYFLLITGALLMLLPFIWMVITSFKLPGEVQQWPPIFTSKNFSSWRRVKVKVSKSSKTNVDFEHMSLEEFLSFSSPGKKEVTEDKLLITVDDDMPIRGTITLYLLDKDGKSASYIPPLSQERQRAVFKKIKEKMEECPTQYKKAINNVVSTSNDNLYLFLANLFAYFRDSKNAFFSRNLFIKRINDTLNRVEQNEKHYGSRLLKHPLLKINETDTSIVKEQKEFITSHLATSFSYIQRKTPSLQNKLLKYKKAFKGIEFTQEELKDIRSYLTDYLNVIKISEDMVKEKTGGQAPYARGILRIYSLRFLSDIQGITKMIDLYNWFTSYFNGLRISHLSSDNIVFRYRTEKEIKDALSTKLNNISMKSYMRNEVMTVFNRSSINAFIPNLLNAMNSDTRKTLGKVLENNSMVNNTFNNLVSAISKEKNIDDILKNYNTDMRKELMDIFYKMSDYIKTIDRINAAYTDIKNRAEILSKPEEIRHVWVRKSGSIEVSFEKGIHPISFMTAKSKMKARFSPSEVFKNIFQSYIDAWNAAPFGRYFLNSVFVASSTTILEIIFASMAAFAFAKMRFFGKNVIFLILLSTMMVPGEIFLIPNYITLTRLGWIDTYYALIVPWTTSVFAIFLLRQYFMTLPDELYDAAKIDGCSRWRFLWMVAVPLSKPIIVTAALLKFIGSWNAFLWVLIMTKSPEMRTIPVGLQNFSSEAGTVYNQLMAASTFSLLPIIVLFLFAQKQLIRGIARTGLK